jgi:hypothetical protein
MDALALHDLYKIYKDGDIETAALRGASLAVLPATFTREAVARAQGSD